MNTPQNHPLVDTSPTAVLAAFSTLKAAWSQGTLGAAVELLGPSGSVEAVDWAANILDHIARESARQLGRKSEAAVAAGDFREAARLNALRRSVEEYSSGVEECHRVSSEFVSLSEDAEALSEVKTEEDAEDFTNISF